MTLESSQHTVLPPTKTDRSKLSQLAPEAHFGTVKADLFYTLPKVSKLNQLEQKNSWILPESAQKLTFTESMDHRMVLPKLSPDASGSQSHRRVILRQGKSKFSLSEPTETAPQQLYSLSTSKLTAAMQACEEELEFLKLKLRYMQNDIEFKQTQIDSAKASHSKGSEMSQPWTRNNAQVQANSIHNVRMASSNSHIVQESKRHPKSSATKWTAPTSAIKQSITKTDFVDVYSLPQGRYISSVDTKSSNSPIVIKSNKSPIVTISNKNPPVTNNSATVHSRTSHLPATASSDTSRSTSNPSEARNGHSSFVKTLTSHAGTTAITDSVSIQQTDYVHTQIEPAQRQHTCYPTYPYNIDTNIMSYGPQTERPLSETSSSTAGTSTASAFQRLGPQELSAAPQPVYVSPNKRLVVFSSKALPVNTVPAKVPFSAGVLSSKLLSVDTVSLKVAWPIGASSSKLLPVDTESSKVACPTSAFSSQPLPVDTVSSKVPWPTCRTVSSPVVAKYSSPNIILHKRDTEIHNASVMGGISSNFSLSRTRSDLEYSRLSEKTGSTFALSKYKLVKIPSSLSAGMTKARVSSGTSFSPNINSNTSHVLSSSMPPNKAATVIKTPSRLSLKNPNLKIQTAAKLVSKYKLKKLSPTSSSATAPPLFYGKAQFKKYASSYELGYHSSFGPYVKNQHKLDRRPIDSGPTTPRPILKKFATDIYNNRGNVLIKKHKLDRRAVLAQPAKTPRDLQRPLSRSKLKTDKRENCRFKWSRPGIQTQNGAWQQLRQKLQMMLNKKQRHSRFKFSTLTSVPTMYTRTARAGDYKTNIVTIDGITYKSSRRKLTRTRRVSGSSSVKRSTSAQNSGSIVVTPRSVSRQKRKLISVGGVHFHVDRSGKRLCRTVPVKSSAPAVVRRSSSCHSDFNVVNYANRAIHRSIAITAAKYKKSNNKQKTQSQHCIFFGRFGKCHRGDKCPYFHDPEKVAVCTRFLRGKCDTKDCPFSHKASVNKMPVCLFYLRGSCSRENCPYLHVRVNPNAPVCKDFRNGFCALGEKCKKIHSHVCPPFAVSGTCSRGETCTMLHRISRREQKGSPAQAKSLSRKVRKQPQIELTKRPAVGINSQRFKSVFTPASTSSLAAQPSYISLESDPMPCFISLEPSPKGGEDADLGVRHCDKPIVASEKVGLTGMNQGQLGIASDVAQSIRPSFLVKKSVVEKIAEQSV